MTLIHITQITSEPEHWIRTIGGYREIEKFGNRHAKFVDSEWLDVHWDEYNATSFPTGTVNHLAKWGNEEMGINEDILRVVGWGALVVLGIKLIQKL